MLFVICLLFYFIFVISRTGLCGHPRYPEKRQVAKSMIVPDNVKRVNYKHLKKFRVSCVTAV